MADPTLEQILTAQVLLLAAQLKAEKARGGVQSTSDFTAEAIRLIRDKRADILARMQ